MKRVAQFLVPLFGLVWIFFHFGCRTLSTSAGSPPSGPVNGMLYYLPIGKVTIKGEYAKADTTAAPARLLAETANEPAATPTPTSTPTPTPAPTPKELTITLTAEVEADEGSGVFYVIPQSNYIYEDEVRVAVNAKHLLSTGNVTTEDKTAEIAGALASLARAGLGVARTVATENAEPFNFTFHPSNYREVDGVAAALRPRGIGLTVTMDGEPITRQTPILPGKEVQRLATEYGRNGLVFRPATSYKIQLTSPAGSGSNVNNAQQLILPDPTKLYAIEYQRMAFVKKVKDIGFTDGMLTEYHQKVPSPILGFIGIPKAVVDAMVPIPGAPPASGSASGSGTTSSKN